MTIAAPSGRTLDKCDPRAAILLELSLDGVSRKALFNRYQKLAVGQTGPELSSAIQQMREQELLKDPRIRLEYRRAGSVFVWEVVNKTSGLRIDLSEVSHVSGRGVMMNVLPLLSGKFPIKASNEELSTLYQKLVELGALVPAPGCVDFGHLRTLVPIDETFGFNRGEVIDRYYQKKFIERTRPLVRGRVLEVGGAKQNLEHFGWSGVSEYVTMDLRPSPDVDIVADISDEKSLAPDTYDVIVLFFVLEHIPEVQRAVDNLWRAVKPGGYVVSLTPVMQRIHRVPVDVARLLPDGLRHIFRKFRDCEVTTYGNLMTSFASLLGLSTDEFDVDELDYSEPTCPVCVGVVARK